MKKLSIVIPTYEVNGIGDKLLSELLESLYNQTNQNFEVVISDHSTTDLIKNEFERWLNKLLDIKYFLNETGRGNSSVNMNNGIKNSSGEFIKIMHIDDKFCNENSIQILFDKLYSDENISWGGFGFNHNYEKEGVVRREMIPNVVLNQEMNTRSLIGCPSVSFFKNDDNFFDENMIIINDFEMHSRLLKKYGEPLIISDICITIRMHSNQVTSILSNYSTKEKEEINYFKTKNNIQ